MLRGPVRKVVGESRLEGRLVDETGSPVAGARVALEHGIAPATSDSDGRFVVENLAHGRYHIHAERDDLSVRTYAQTRRSIDVVMKRRPMLRVFVRDGEVPVAGANISLGHVIASTDANGVARIPAYGGLTRADVIAAGYAPTHVATATDVDGELPEERVVQLQRGAMISGLVIGDDQQPIPEARVQVRAPYRGQKLRANQAGAWETLAIAGRYELVASSDTQVATVPVIVVHDGVTSQTNIILRTIAGAELGATVYDERNKPCEAIVYLMARTDLELPKLARCNAHGDAVLTGLEPGTYDLFAVTDDDHASKQVEVTLVAGQRRDFDITVEPGRAIAGTVVDASGTPVENAEVLVATKSLHTAVTDSAGRFHLGGMPESEQGTYHVSARPPDGDWVSSSSHCSARPGDTALVIVLPSPTRVVGTVRFEGAPMPYFGVTLGAGRNVYTFRTGRFEIALQRPDRVQIMGPGTAREVIEISSPSGGVIDL
ncbi:MAG TPA: carboxypeptidase-like regulatory domain-containing protein, partial [Kofleriaceae bacterium]